MIIALVYVPFLQFGFGTRGIVVQEWFIAVPFAVFIIFYDELRKLMFRAYGKETWFFKNLYY